MQRILTGDRTTGRLHLGHYIGSLQNRVRLQNEYDTFILLADVQALTTHFKQPQLIADSIYQVAIDNLSAGIDPEKITLVQQSQVGAIAELTVLFSMLVSINSLRHNPTIKTEAKQYGYDDLSYGFLGYPVSQTADLAFCGAELVPVGEDQLPHMEAAHRILRRFNDLYGETFCIPQALLSNTARLPGVDGNAKMGKSLGNAIYLSDDAGTVAAKLRAARTDTRRLAVTDPGDPEVCTVGAYHRAFAPEGYAEICENCRGGRIGCAACKKKLTEQLNALLEPVREKRAYYEAHREQVKELIAAGTARANAIGAETLTRVKTAMSVLL